MNMPNPSQAFQIDTAPQHRAEALTCGGTTAQIVLDDKIYTLRITRAGKLILTK